MEWEKNEMVFFCIQKTSCLLNIWQKISLKLFVGLFFLIALSIFGQKNSFMYDCSRDIKIHIGNTFFVSPTFISICNLSFIYDYWFSDFCLTINIKWKSCEISKWDIDFSRPFLKWNVCHLTKQVFLWNQPKHIVVKGEKRTH